MSRFNFQALQQQASNAVFQPPRQPNQETPHQNNNHNSKSLTARRQDQQKEEKASERREMLDEVTKLATLSKPKLRQYFEDQIDENNNIV